jgi:hypothetical protein
MKFSSTHRITTHLTVLFAHLSLILSGEPISPWISLIALVCLGVSFFWEPKPKSSQDHTGRISAVLGVLVVLYTFLDFWRITSMGSTENLLLAPFSHLLLLFQSTRLFARRKSQDYLWIYIISFFELITATAINEDPSYALCFIGYSISVTWALILFHLRREMEDNYLLRHSNDASSEKVEVERILGSKRIINSSFLLITGLLAFFVVLIGAFASLLLPRLEGGPQVTKWRWQKLIGFSDKVSLGEFGRLRQNLRVVMRVSLPGEDKPQPTPLYLRGVIFDTYEVRTWSSRGNLEDTFTKKVTDLSAVQGPTRKLSILLEPIDSAALFVSNATTKVSFPDEPSPSVLRDSLGNLSYNGSRHGVLHYEIEDSLQPLHKPLSKEQIKHYTQSSGWQFGVGALAEQIVGGSQDPYEMATKIQDYLRSNYQYSLILTPDPNKPLEDFLFNTKSGHCQYFATAMAILLRTRGVPTRLVNGFYGGEWNDYGKYYAVRQSDAHSWVEVFIEGKGWVVFDPTPTAPVVRDGWLGELGRAYDAARMRWFSGFIDYDLFAQKGLLQTAKRLFVQWLWVALAAAIVAALVVVLSRLYRKYFRWRKVQPRKINAWSPPTPQEEKGKESEDKKKLSRLYRRALDLLAKRGHTKPPSLTAREYAETLTQQKVQGASLLAAITQLYEAARFGDMNLEQNIDALSLQLKQLERELSKNDKEQT